jgi:heparanase 1
VKKLRRYLWPLAALPVAGLCLLGVEPARGLQSISGEHLDAVDGWVSAGLRLAYGAPAQATPQARSLVSVSLGAPLRELEPRFLSVAIDTSLLLGGRWWSPTGRVEVGRGTDSVPPLDLARAELRELARALAPAYLRIGGTEADRVHYAFGAAAHELPQGDDELTLDPARWDALAEFTHATGLDLFFTINAGPGARNGKGEWQPEPAERLLQYAAQRGDAVSVWELGNEVNAFWFQHGLHQQPSGTQYAADLHGFRALVKRHFPSARVAGPAVAYFPLLGEPLPARVGFLPAALQHAGGALDILSWHFYPQQSRRCPAATRRAVPGQLLAPAELDEMARWSRELQELRERHAPGAELWLGETGSAQCGGEPGLSDRFASGLWWLDELGSAARDGQAVVIRQALIGADYGLIDPQTLQPRPDYFNSLAWKRWMGPRVLAVARSGDNPWLRTYAHCSALEPGVAVLLALNVDVAQPAAFRVGAGTASVTGYELTASALDSKELRLNGAPLALGRTPSGMGWPASAGRELPAEQPIVLPPASYGFFELRGAAACQSSEPAPRSSTSSGSAAG